MPDNNLEICYNFLAKLRDNNHREWFNAHKDQYKVAHDALVQFANDVLAKLSTHDQIETVSGKKSLFRIYRDVRFSKDKTPYQTHFSGSFRRATQYLRGGYYFRIQPGNTLIAGGFWGPNSEDIRHIREQIAADDDPLRAVLTDKALTNYFGELQGERVKTAPKGFSRDHPAIDLIRHKQFILAHSFSDAEAKKVDFADKVNDGFKRLRPFFDQMTELLTTDLNGSPLF